MGGGTSRGGAWAGGPVGERTGRGGGRAGDFPVAEGHGYPHQCLSRQRTQRVHASLQYNMTNIMHSYHALSIFLFANTISINLF